MVGLLALGELSEKGEGEGGADNLRELLALWHIDFGYFSYRIHYQNTVDFESITEWDREGLLAAVGPLCQG